MNKKDLRVQITVACFDKLKRLAEKDQQTLRVIVEKALNTYFKRRARKR